LTALGYVKAVSNGYYDKKGRFHVKHVNEGDLVMFMPHRTSLGENTYLHLNQGGIYLNWEGEDLLFLRFNEILGVVDEDRN